VVWSLAASLVLVAIAFIASAAWSSRASVSSAQTDTAAAAIARNAPADIALTAATSSGNPVYRYSIVPGGVHSQEDVSKAIADDAVVAKHYQHVEPTRLRVE
jgi:hypothetical protein